MPRGRDRRGRESTDRDEAFIAGDALRGLASTGVFVFHAAFGAALAGGFAPVLAGDAAADLGGGFGPEGEAIEALTLGVYVFFSLSGYLLSRRFIRAYVEGTRMPSGRSFLRNRVLRIVPAFWLVAALSMLRHGTGESSIWEILAIPAGMQVFVHGDVTHVIEHAWTIDTEWALYLGLPLVALAAPRAGTPRARLGLVLAAIATLFAASLAVRWTGPGGTYAQRAFWSAGWSFLPGVLLAAIEVALAHRLRGAAWGPRAALALAAAFPAVLIAHESLPLRSAGPRALLASVAVLLALGAPLVLQWTAGRAWRALDNRPLRALGRWSYGFYLVHFLVGVEVARLIDAAGSPRERLLLTAPVAFAISLALAAASYRWVELPFLRRRERRPSTLDVGQVGDVRPVGLVAGRAGGQPGVEDLAEQRG